MTMAVAHFAAVAGFFIVYIGIYVCVHFVFEHLQQFCTGDHLSGKPENVRDFTENQGIVRGKMLSRNSCVILFIVNCIFVSIQVFSRSLLCLKC